MRARRLVLVLPAGRRGESWTTFHSFSLLAHVLFLALLVLAPSFRRHAPSLGDALVVELAGGLPVPPDASLAGARALAPPAPAPTRAPEPPRVVPDPEPKKRDKERKEKKQRKEPPTEPAAGFGAGPAPAPAPVPAAGPGAGGAGPGSAGGITSLDAADVEFAWYRALVTSALKSRWVRPVLEGNEPVTATVAFEIRRDGSVQDVHVETPSGVSAMDRSVLRAVIESSPLPPLPPNWREPTLSARFEFRWRPGDAE